MPKIENLNRLMQKLDKLKAKGKDASNASVTVGFTQNYAAAVHENLEAHHDVGQAKFLEQPARELNNNGELSRLVSAAVKAGKTVEQGLLVAGLRIQREAQKLTPVDTGALKASAFTSITRDENQAAADAFERSNALKRAKMTARAKKAETKKLKNLPRAY
jgi:hypothetical protein